MTEKKSTNWTALFTGMAVGIAVADTLLYVTGTLPTISSPVDALILITAQMVMFTAVWLGLDWIAGRIKS